MERSRLALRMLAVLSLAIVILHPSGQSKSKFLRAESDEKERRQTLGKRNPAARALRQERDLKKLAQIREKAEQEEREARAAARAARGDTGPKQPRKPKPTKPAPEMQKLSPEQKYEHDFRLKVKYIEEKVRWDLLEIPVVVQSVQTKKVANFTTKFEAGMKGLQAKARAALFDGKFVSGTWSISYEDPHKKKLMSLNNEDNLKTAALFYLKNTVHFSKSVVVKVSIKANSDAPRVVQDIHIYKNKTKIDPDIFKQQRAAQKSEKQKSAKQNAQKAKQEAKERELQKRKEQRERNRAEAAKKEKILQEMTKELPPGIDNYDGIKWSPLLRQYEASFIHPRGRSNLGMFKTKEMAWSAICMHAKQEGIDPEILLRPK